MEENSMDFLMEWIEDDISKNHSNGQQPKTESSVNSVELSKEVPLPNMSLVTRAMTAVDSEKIQKYAENMRRLIITARRQIGALEEQNQKLKRQAESEGVVRCPSCDHCHKKKVNRFLPTFIKAYPARFALELTFQSKEDLFWFMEASQLEADKNGIPVLAPTVKVPPKSLAESGSMLSKLVEERQKLIKVAVPPRNETMEPSRDSFIRKEPILRRSPRKREQETRASVPSSSKNAVQSDMTRSNGSEQKNLTPKRVAVQSKSLTESGLKTIQERKTADKELLRCKLTKRTDAILRRSPRKERGLECRPSTSKSDVQSYNSRSDHMRTQKRLEDEKTTADELKSAQNRDESSRDRFQKIQQTKGSGVESKRTSVEKEREDGELSDDDGSKHKVKGEDSRRNGKRQYTSSRDEPPQKRRLESEKSRERFFTRDLREKGSRRGFEKDERHMDKNKRTGTERRPIESGKSSKRKGKSDEKLLSSIVTTGIVITSPEVEDILDSDEYALVDEIDEATEPCISEKSVQLEQVGTDKLFHCRDESNVNSVSEAAEEKKDMPPLGNVTDNEIDETTEPCYSVEQDKTEGIEVEDLLQDKDRITDQSLTECRPAIEEEEEEDLSQFGEIVDDDEDVLAESCDSDSDDVFY